MSGVYYQDKKGQLQQANIDKLPENCGSCMFLKSITIGPSDYYNDYDGCDFETLSLACRMNGMQIAYLKDNMPDYEQKEKYYLGTKPGDCPLFEK